MVLLKARSREWIMIRNTFDRAVEIDEAIRLLQWKIKELERHNLIEVSSLLPVDHTAHVMTPFAIDTWLNLKNEFIKKADYTSVFDQLIIDIKEKIKLLKLEFKKL